MGEILKFYPRYQWEGELEIPGYNRVVDRIGGQKLGGRRIPKSGIAPEVMKWLTHVQHFSLVPVFFRTQLGLDWVTVSPIEPDLGPFYPEKWRALGSGQISQALFQFISASEFLWRHGFIMKQFSLKQFLFDNHHGGRIGYLENLVPLSHIEPESFAQLFSWTYLPPESQENQVFNSASLVYYLGQIFVHVFSGSPYGRIKGTRQDFLKPHTLRKDWKDLIWDMTHPDPHERPGWDTILKTAARLAGVSRRNIPKVRFFQFEGQSFGEELKSGRQMAIAMQMGPGREGVYFRNKLIDWSQENEYLLLHLWQQNPSSTAYESINQLVELFRGDLNEVLGYSESFRNLPNLTSWQSPEEIRNYWCPVVQELKRALFSSRYRGVVFLLEDLHHMDCESIASICSLLNWLKGESFLLAVTTPYFLEKNLKILKKKCPISLKIKKPPRISMATLRSITDQFQMGTMKTAYKEIHQDVLGNQTLLMCELNRRGSALEFLEQIWRKMKPGWQRFFSMLSCAFQPLTKRDIERFLSPEDLPDQILLESMGLLNYEPSEGAMLSIPMVRTFCRGKLDNQTTRFIQEKLLALKSTGRFQKFCLQLDLGRKEEASVGFMPAVDEMLERPSHLWGGLLDSTELLSMDQEMGMGLKSIRQLISGRLESKSLVGKAQFMSWYRKGLKAESDGNLPLAVSAFKKSAKQREVPFLVKVRSLAKAAECLCLSGGAGVSRILRQYLELSWPSETKPMETYFSAKWLGLDLKTNRLAELDPGPWHHWPKAFACWREGDYTNCLFHVEKLLKNRPPWMDDRELGELFKLYGNALFKNYHTSLALKAYEKADAFYRSAGHENALLAVAFNRASTEKLSGNLMQANRAFLHLLSIYTEKKDLESETQILFNLMEVSLLRGQYNEFEQFYARHYQNARKLKDPIEMIRGLVVGLHHSLQKPGFMVEKALVELENLMKWHPVDDLIKQEAQLAKYIAGIRLQTPGCTDSGGGRFVQARTHFLNFLCGGTDHPLNEILQSRDSGFFRGLLIQLVCDSVQGGYLRKESIPRFFRKGVQTYSRKNGANFHSMLGIGVDAEASTRKREWMRDCLAVFAKIHKQPDPTHLEQVLRLINKIWPFECWGIWDPKKRFKLGSSFGTLPLFFEKSLTPGLAGFSVPEIRSWYDDEGTSCDYLFLPVDEGAFWFCGQEKEQKPYASELQWLLLKEILCALRDRLQPQSQPKLSMSVKRTFPEALDERFIGESDLVQNLKQEIALFGNSDLGIHISGESGTGKELVARLLHDVSPRRAFSFRAINCCDYSENLIQSELFGHNKGAFTGADRDRVGLLEQLNGGTLFLDEIGDLTPKVQSLLLRFLQEKEFSRMGCNRVRKVDVRVLTATNKSLQKMMDQGQFRPDLFFRIAETELEIPPLRARGSDIAHLVKHLTRKYAPERQVRFEPDFLNALKSHSWPGNIRELENYIRKVLVMNPDKPHLNAEHMPEFVKSTLKSSNHQQTLAEFESENRRVFICNRLEQFGGNRTLTSESLGITRQQLVRIIKKHEI